VGFRPLQEFDTYNSIVACPEENATFGGKCVYPGRLPGPIFTNKANLRLPVLAETEHACAVELPFLTKMSARMPT